MIIIYLIIQLNALLSKFLIIKIGLILMIKLATGKCKELKLAMVVSIIEDGQILR